jgi:hypothetical protein
VIRSERLTADIDGDFVIFLIGMRINSFWRIHKWWPVAKAMPRMLAELQRQPELGLLHASAWLGGRDAMTIQYWRSMEHLITYAASKDAAHLPAWQAFNRAVGTDGTVGIWHETYLASAGSHETVYVNMPPFGLGKAGTLEPAAGRKFSALSRMRPPAA